MKAGLVLALLIAAVYSKSYSIVEVDKCVSPNEMLRISQCRADETRKIFLVDGIVKEKIAKFTVSWLEKICGYPKTFIFQITASVFVLTDSVYKHLFKSSEIDFCNFMKRTKNASPALKLIIDAIKATSGNLLHRCPYFGPHAANITVSRNVVSFIPPGRYKVSAEGRTAVDSVFLNISLVVDILNSD